MEKRRREGCAGERCEQKKISQLERSGETDQEERHSRFEDRGGIKKRKMKKQGGRG